MPYDYSRKFLARHAPLVKELQDLATTGAIKGWSSTEWEVIRNQQALVNNLLASMARNITGLDKIREVMACWTEFGGNGEYHLYVGHWTLRPKKGQATAETFVPAAHVTSLVYRHLDQAKDALDTFTEFDLKVKALDRSYKRAEIEIPLEARSADQNDLKEWAETQWPDWAVTIEGINLILQR